MPMHHDIKPFIMTFSGQKFKLPQPDPGSIKLIDIAHALSQIARFGAHTAHRDRTWNNDAPILLSVAEHSVRVMECLELVGCNSATVRAGLLHDASEAYLGDMPAPFKLLMPDYCELERNLQFQIYEAFGVDWSEVDDELLHHFDGLDCMREARQYMGNISEWPEYPKFYEALQSIPPIRPLEPYEAKEQFLNAAQEFGLNAE